MTLISLKVKSEIATSRIVLFFSFSLSIPFSQPLLPPLHSECLNCLPPLYLPSHHRSGQLL